MEMINGNFSVNNSLTVIFGDHRFLIKITDLLPEINARSHKKESLFCCQKTPFSDIAAKPKPNIGESSFYFFRM